MVEAHSLNNILERISSELPRTVTVLKKEEKQVFGLMTSLSMNQPVTYQTVRIQETRDTKLVGILFAHPQTSLAQSEIIKFLQHFHLRSGDAIDFFCVGYGAYWPPEHYADQSTVVKIDGVDWLFSEQAFSNVIDELEASTKWNFSGETELLLVTAKKESNSEQVKLDFSTAIICNLEKMSKDNAFTSVRAFFNDLFNYAKQHSESDPTWGLSDNRGFEVGKSALKDAVLSLLPDQLKESYKKAENYAIRNIEK